MALWSRNRETVFSLVARDLRLFCDGGQVWCGGPAPSLPSHTETRDGPDVTQFCPGQVNGVGRKTRVGVNQKTGEVKGHTITRGHAGEG